MRHLRLFENYAGNTIKVVRWAKEKIPAAELTPQKFEWGGFEETALCFTPFTDEKDPRIHFWEKMVSSHHKAPMVKNFYRLDISALPFKNEKALAEFAKLTYDSIRAENVMKNEYKMHLTLADLDGHLGEDGDLVEIRLYPGCKIKVLNY